MITPARTLLIAVALVLLTACGSNVADNADARTGAKSEDSGGDTATPTEAPYRVLTKRALTAALLGVQDLPPGYSQDPPTNDGRSKTFCDYKPPFTEKIKVSRDFTKGGGMSAELLRVMLRQYAGQAQAKAAFKALTKSMKTCTNEVYDGTEVTYAVMSAPKVGDDSIGIKMTADGTTLLQTFVLVGPTLVSTGGGGLMNANADEVNGLIKAQVNEYQDAASG